MKICKLCDKCERYSNKCESCSDNAECDFCWINNLWQAENKKFGKDSLLGPGIPIFIKNDLKSSHIISVTGKYDFCCFNVPKSKDVIVISDIYVDEAVRGQKISTRLLQYLMETYDRDIFAKCVRGTSAEDFWNHIGVQVDANAGTLQEHDMYEHRPGKRDLGWYRVENKNKKQNKVELF